MNTLRSELPLCTVSTLFINKSHSACCQESLQVVDRGFKVLMNQMKLRPHLGLFMTPTPTSNYTLSIPAHHSTMQTLIGCICL